MVKKTSKKVVEEVVSSDEGEEFDYGDDLDDGSAQDGEGADDFVSGDLDDEDEGDHSDGSLGAASGGQRSMYSGEDCVE